MAACAVRTLARTETFMPIKPAAPESTAPMANPSATNQPRKYPTTKKMTIPTPAMVVYCRFRYACAPSRTAAEISCMRWLPASACMTDQIAQTPYTIASRPQMMITPKAVIGSNPDWNLPAAKPPAPESGADIAKKRPSRQRLKYRAGFPARRFARAIDACQPACPPARARQLAPSETTPDRADPHSYAKC